jgi:hypothetical protein
MLIVIEPSACIGEFAFAGSGRVFERGRCCEGNCIPQLLAPQRWQGPQDLIDAAVFRQLARTLRSGTRVPRSTTSPPAIFEFRSKAPSNPDIFSPYHLEQHSRHTKPSARHGSTAGRLRAGRPVDSARQAACGGAEKRTLRLRRPAPRENNWRGGLVNVTETRYSAIGIRAALLLLASNRSISAWWRVENGKLAHYLDFGVTVEALKRGYA